MPCLLLQFLGPFRVTLGDAPLEAFESNKVRALLAFLATEADRPHARESLAALLWPNRPEPAARACLRSALSNLRLVIGDAAAAPPHLLVTRYTLQFNPAGDHVRDFAGLLDPAHLSTEQKEGLAAAYHGEFLEGFSPADCPAFDEWLLTQREQFRRRMIELLRDLAVAHEAAGAPERAIDFTRRQLELEAWDEEAHRRLMRLLYRSGRRGLALAQYETCCRLLREELGVAPDHETVALWERIRADDL